MDDVIRVHDQFYILASSSRVDDRTGVLKDGETFALFDRYGDMHSLGLGELGLYHEGTRFLSRLEVTFGTDRAFLLSSNLRSDNAALAVDLANPDVRAGDRIVVPADTVHLFRLAFLWKDVLYQRLRVRNFGSNAVEIPLWIRFEADFVDIFEVRGMTRKRRGTLRAPVVDGSAVALGYDGLDGQRRIVRLRFDPAPTRIERDHVEYRLSLAPKDASSIQISVACESSRAPHPRIVSYEEAFAAAGRAVQRLQARQARVSSTNGQVNDWLNRSVADLEMMLTELPQGPYPYAGIPWYSTVFGRDGIITALQTLWIDPAIARGVLGALAAVQATELDPERDAEPGKIVHEMRDGEMAALREIPFGRYYGTVDATPLFVLLAGAYYERTGDTPFIEQIWPNIEAALRWIDQYGDPDGDGFVEYDRRNADGLVNQGWKDSQDSIFHADGTLAEGPIALCEVQAYVYAAKLAAADLAAALGDPERSRALAAQARALQARFEEAFWCDDLGTYALALDGAKRPCRVRTSNAGHALFGGLTSRERAATVAATLLGAELFSGWGVRTVGSAEVRYNPMSYHNGSVWPHDNALIALGLSRYGLKDGTLALFSALFEASCFVEMHRLPELFCGFARRNGEGPTRYPVACSPQAWAVGTPFMLLQACLGLHASAAARRLMLIDPVLPPFLREISITNLVVGDASVDLRLHRRGGDVALHVTRKSGTLDIELHK